MNSLAERNLVNYTKEEVLALPAGQHRLMVKLMRTEGRRSDSFFQGEATIAVIRREEDYKIDKTVFKAGGLIYEK